MTVKMKKKFSQELDTLKSESEEFRNHYGLQMQQVVTSMEEKMTKSVMEMNDVFSLFHKYGSNKATADSKLIANFRSDFKKMSFPDLFTGYLKNEVPAYS